MTSNGRTLYCFVDESGQDTAGRFFVVSVLVTDQDHRLLTEVLEKIEKESKKGAAKWHKAHYRYRQAFVANLVDQPLLRRTLYAVQFLEGTEYLAKTAAATVEVLRLKRAKRAIVSVDGLRQSERPRFKRYLKASAPMRVTVRGVRRDENNTLIRLVDAICGLVRDAHERQTWAVRMVRKLERSDILKQL